MTSTPCVWLVSVLSLLASPAARAQQPVSEPRPAPASPAPETGSFTIVFDPAVHAGPYSGRVYIVLATDGRREPRVQMNGWFGGPQILAQDVTDIAPGVTVVVAGAPMGYPKRASEVAPAEYVVQAVARASLDSPTPGTGPGDLYSEPVKIAYRPGDPGTTELRLTKVVEERPFRESERIKLVEMVSPKLSEFYGREVKVRAGVLLPEGWSDDAEKRYPTVYMITGFGGDHHSVRSLERRLRGDGAGAALFVVPDPLCHFGHSVFADSENNGPRGAALVEELIPEVEKRYHGAQSAERRFVTGVSSGGWSSLWLQITYPEFFGGCWSHCPDPVDFRDFQQIDLYADANMYTDGQGQRRPLARDGDQVRLWYDDFVRREWVLGPGGQIQSFEGVFSRRTPDGLPEPLFDRITGKVDPAVARTWEKYDIRLILERNWKTLGPRLAGKLHVYAGGMDTFYLEGAARLLKDSLEQLGSDAECEIVPGMPHTLHQPGWDAMMKTVISSGGAD